jgi:hypothetical protein
VKFMGRCGSQLAAPSTDQEKAPHRARISRWLVATIYVSIVGV